MSVVAGKRGTTQVDFFKRAYRLNDSITQLLIRDFGIKSRLRDLTTFTYSAKMSKKDREKFMELCNKYSIDVEASFPYWLIEHYREKILNILAEMINNITQAYTIYPGSLAECELKRRYQWSAISNCYQLLQSFQIAIRNLPVNITKYETFVTEIKAEIESLKEWKKNGNKVFNKFKERS